MSYRETVDYISATRKGETQAGDCSITSKMRLVSVINGRDDPKWRDKVMRGENATGSLVRTQYSVRYTDFPSTQVGKKDTIYEGNWCTTFNHGVILFNPVSLNNTSYYSKALADAESAAITAIRNKVRKEQAAFGGMTFLAELSSTIKGLRNPGKALAENLKSLLHNVSLHNKMKHVKTETTQTAKGRRANLKLARNRKARHRAALRDRSRLLTGKTFAETWLEFYFGWAPLVNDVRDIAEGLTSYFWKDSIRRVYGSSGDVQRSVSTSCNNCYSNGTIACSGTTETVTTVRVKYAVGVARRATGPDGQIKALLGESGSIRHDLFPAIWEAIPWSFLIDYVTNIGDIISAATQSTTGVKWVSKTTVINVVQTTVVKPVPRTGYVLTNIGQSTVTSKFTKIIRESVEPSNIGVPMLTFSLPGSQQLLNVAALLRTFLRS